jgi:uncharacterized protein (TIGR03067 family)
LDQRKATTPAPSKETTMRPFVIFALLAATHASTASGQDSIAEAIQGHWQAISLQDGGRIAPAEIVAGFQWIVAEGTITEVADGERTEAPYTLDETQTPAWIDMQRGTRVMLGIVKLEADTLTVCFAERRDAGRSTAFESRPDSPNDVLVVFKRTGP